jgi:hypothetical protein
LEAKKNITSGEGEIQRRKIEEGGKDPLQLTSGGDLFIISSIGFLSSLLRLARCLPGNPQELRMRTESNRGVSFLKVRMIPFFPEVSHREAGSGRQEDP